MTGATSTNGGGGGAAARTLPLLQPRAFSRRTALTKPVDICFIISFPSIELLTFLTIASRTRLNRDAARLKGNVPRESSRRFQARPSRDCTLHPRANRIPEPTGC